MGANWVSNKYFSSFLLAIGQYQVVQGGWIELRENPDLVFKEISFLRLKDVQYQLLYLHVCFGMPYCM